MLVLSALCVLLPLVAALETCDKDKAAALLAKGQLKGNVLDNLGGKKFWFVAVGDEGSGDDISATVNFGEVSDDKVSLEFVNYFANGTKTTRATTYELVDDHVVASTNNAYFFQCSENLIGGYRCEGDSSQVASGNEYFVWAAWDKSEADIIGELESCLQKYAGDTTFWRRVHP